MPWKTIFIVLLKENVNAGYDEWKDREKRGNAGDKVQPKDQTINSFTAELVDVSLCPGRTYTAVAVNELMRVKLWSREERRQKSCADGKKHKDVNTGEDAW